jgi:hypothetical protein
VATLGHATKKLHIICLRVFSPPRWMAIFQVLKVVPPRKHQQSPRNFKQSQNEAKKKRERMVKQSQSKFKQSSRGNNLMKSKDITNMSLQEVLTSKKKSPSTWQASIEVPKNAWEPLEKKAVDSHSPLLAKA